MSTSPSKPVSFTMEIGCCGFGKNLPLKLKLPKHKFYPFEASSFDLIDSSAAFNTNDKLSERLTVTPFCGSLTMDERYRIANKGQLQIIIKNPSSTAIKVFLIPYDHTNMPNDTKTISRQKTYSNSNLKKTKILLSAIHLQYVKIKNKLYIDRKMRLVFSSKSFPEFKDEVFNVLNETKFEYVKLCEFDYSEDVNVIHKSSLSKSFNLERRNFYSRIHDDADDEYGNNNDRRITGRGRNVVDSLHGEEEDLQNEMNNLDLNR
ncbi:hypothetical protein HK099_003070 [Clydaea vesicula]|uniref:Atos-like conserved domain-containing protein n=1 Tax=Clydaea vesicula TaxID=447962 RepID=A0AAD5U1Y7_9FUNG|nr:hypothetical protein HK099_003070 [Clydaea vesicula]